MEPVMYHNVTSLTIILSVTGNADGLATRLESAEQRLLQNMFVILYA